MEDVEVTRSRKYTDAISKFNAVPPKFAGRHTWVYLGAWQVAGPARERQVFDYDNLVTVTGPGCYWCEQEWSPTIGAHCPGQPVE